MGLKSNTDFNASRIIALAFTLAAPVSVVNTLLELRYYAIKVCAATYVLLNDLSNEPLFPLFPWVGRARTGNTSIDIGSPSIALHNSANKLKQLKNRAYVKTYFPS